jgi:predicted flap endonuclease-1-like 5' DNA nuclease
MPDLSATHIVLLAVLTAVGAVAGWILRGRQAENEKAAVSAGWQEQIDAQRKESKRLLDQNKGLMEQVSQFQAQHTDAKNRAKELSLAVQEAFARRDDLQREIKDVRSSLETVLSERDQLASDMQTRDANADLLREKDERIEKLTRELENWQNRLPPLIDRYRVRNEEAERAEAELEEARARILQLEEAQSEVQDNDTRIEPVHHPEELTDGLDACNDAEDDFDDDLETEINEAFVADDPVDNDDEYWEEDDPDDEDDSWEDSDDGYDDDLPAEDSAILAEAVAAELETEPREQRDDLQMIKGVGPAIEKTLNEMGIFNFQQIADLSEYDIDRVARRLKGFHSRIHREDWIGQARMLLDQAAHA